MATKKVRIKTASQMRREIDEARRAKEFNKTQNTYTLLKKMYEGYFEAAFSFHAEDISSAKLKAINWAHYHEMNRTDVDVRIATKEEAKNWVHDEYL